MRVVIDSNCLISALLFSQTKLAWLRHSWQSKQIQPVVCKQTVTDLMRVLSYPKFKLSASEQNALLAEFLPFAETIADEIPQATPTCRDLHDQVFINLATYAKVKVLVTGDEDLLELKNQTHAFEILTLSEFKQWLA